MNRRQLMTMTAAGAASQILPVQQSAEAATPKKVLMKLGCQSGPTTDTKLQYFKRHSVNNICGYPEDSGKKGFYSVEDLSKTKDLCEKHGVALDCIAPPFLASSHIDRTERPAIMLGQSPERDRDIEAIQNIIKNCAKVGIPSIKYNMSLLGVLRSGTTPGRGGVVYSTWKLADAKGPMASKFPEQTKAGPVNADLYWERITYFLGQVIPVANEYKIRMACHPNDSPVPPEGFEKIDAVLGTVDGLKKFVSIKESPYHGLNFCQGTISEMLADPGKEIFDVIRYFGTRKKIFNVHFRNIKGHRNDFMEVFPDEGDIDFVKALMTYREVGYEYMVMPDHVPHHADDKGGSQAFAFCYGYIRALIQALDRLG